MEIPTDQGSYICTDQVLCKITGISDLHCAMYRHMQTNAKSVVTFEIGIIPCKSTHFSKGYLVRRSNMLLICS